MRKQTLYYIAIPLITNGALALGSFIFLTDEFTNSVFLCYLIGGVAAITSLVSIGGFVLHDIGSPRAVIALGSQATALIFVYAGIYRGFGLAKECPLLDYDTALYFSVVTWTTLGYGDFAPASALQLLAALQAGLGYVFLGLIVGMVANLISAKAG